MRLRPQYCIWAVLLLCIPQNKWDVNLFRFQRSHNIVYRKNKRENNYEVLRKTFFIDSSNAYHTFQDDVSNRTMTGTSFLFGDISIPILRFDDCFLYTITTFIITKIIAVIIILILIITIIPKKLIKSLSC